jgi:hypothetical protein
VTTIAMGNSSISEASVVVFGATVLQRTRGLGALVAEVQGPLRAGSAHRAAERGAGVLVILEAVWAGPHALAVTELLDVVSRGVCVFAAGPLGVVRALELDVPGVIGSGDMFEAARRVSGMEQRARLFGCGQAQAAIRAAGALHLCLRERGQLDALDAALSALVEHSARACPAPHALAEQLGPELTRQIATRDIDAADAELTLASVAAELARRAEYNRRLVERIRGARGA